VLIAAANQGVVGSDHFRQMGRVDKKKSSAGAAFTNGLELQAY
jgi:hypothetical protein